MVHNLAGPPVKGRDFYDRVHVQKELWDFLHRDHILLLAPRRVGKTSLMHELKTKAPDKGVRAVYCSGADAQDEGGFIERLLAAVADLDAGVKALKALKKSPVGKVLKKVKRLKLAGWVLEFDSSKGDWAAVGDALATVLADQKVPWLLLVDELPMFVLKLLRADENEGATRARAFLEWFRSLRQRTDIEGRVRWLLAGSIGLDTVTARFYLGNTINDLHIYHLGPFSETDADGLLRELSRTHELPLGDEERAHMIQRVGWLIPYHLQLLFAELRSLCRERKEEPALDTIDEAFEILLSPAKKAYFDYWRQRLHVELGKPDADFALALLAATARDESGATRETLGQVLGEHIAETSERNERLRYLLDVLEGDGYLVFAKDRFRFRSPLVHEFWKRRVLL